MKRYLPSYPLFVKDPFFSFWMPSEQPGESDTLFWTRQPKRLFGYVCVGGKVYRFLGAAHGEALRATDVAVTAFETIFTYDTADFTLQTRYFSPLRPDDADMIARPVCYFNYTITPKKELGAVRVILSADQAICYDAGAAEAMGEAFVRGGVVKTFEKVDDVAMMARRRQLMLDCTGDVCEAESGYWYLAGEQAYIHEEAGFAALFAKEVPAIPDPEHHLYMSVCADALQGQFLFAFDDIAPIFYFGEVRRGYWFRDGKTIYDALAEAKADYSAVKASCDAFDETLRRAAQPYGEDYLALLYASLRQSVAAHKLIADEKGNLIFLSKECNSNGCIATVDVSYPSIPLYLLYAPKLVKGMMLPVLRFARTPAWKYDFAPHDAGRYPMVAGQYYGTDKNRGIDVGGRNARETIFMTYNLPAGVDVYAFGSQMPVEECANLLVMAAAYYEACGRTDNAFLCEHFDLFAKWVVYLEQHGFLPERQLCTDDFAGHLDKNINLSIKASVGIGCFAKICEWTGHDGSVYLAKAKDHAQRLLALMPKEGATPLTFDGGDTFSLKYNLLFDRVLGLGLYPQEFLEREVDTYLARANTFGTPLDSRKEYTKSDWILWAAALSASPEKRKAMLAPVARFLRESPARAAFSDWYETKTGEMHDFQNRTVQGGIFALLLKE